MKKWIFTFAKKDAPNISLNITIEYSREIQSTITAVDQAWKLFKLLGHNPAEWQEVKVRTVS